jgi:hypothetical protein
VPSAFSNDAVSTAIAIAEFESAEFETKTHGADIRCSPREDGSPATIESTSSAPVNQSAGAVPGAGCQ